MHTSFIILSTTARTVMYDTVTVLQTINNEEELFEWEVTPFPQVQVLTASKEPFERLWNTAVEFHEKHDKWMNGITAVHDCFIRVFYDSIMHTFLTH